MGASGESLRLIVMLLAEYTLGLKVKGNAVDKSRSKAESCSSRRFSMALRSAPGRSLLRNRRQRQISFRSHLISLNVSSIEVITDVDHFVPGVSSMAIVIERPPLGSAFLPNNCIRGLATSARSFGEQFDVCNSYQSISPYDRACDEKSLQILAFSRRCDRVPCTIPALHRIDWCANKNREPESSQIHVRHADGSSRSY